MIFNSSAVNFGASLPGIFEGSRRYICPSSMTPSRPEFSSARSRSLRRPRDVFGRIETPVRRPEMFLGWADFGFPCARCARIACTAKPMAEHDVVFSPGSLQPSAA